MSKLTDLLTRVTRGPQARMGFGPRSMDKVPPLVLLGAGSASDLKAEEAGQLDGLLLSEQQPASSPAEGLVWGVQGNPAETTALRDAGADFVAFAPAETPASFLNDETLGKVLIVDPAAPDSMLRASDALPTDATLLDVSGGPLTVERLITTYRIDGLIRKPLITIIEPSWGEAELVALRDAGALGVLVRLPAPEGALARLHESIENLPARKRPRPRGEALLPPIREEAPPSQAPETDPDEDDDDD